MQALILGFAALAIGLLLVVWFQGANTAALARVLRIIFGTLAIGLAALFATRGYPSYALPLAMSGVLLLLYASVARTVGPQHSSGQTSRITTDTLDMELDHDTGEMQGAVLRGEFAGRSIETMAPAELVRLWQDCSYSDPSSAQLIEAYLDQRHGNWRDDFARSRGTADNQSGGPDGEGPMTRTEALAILGVREGASADEIRRAHRELMKRVHPDRGGSDYLAAKINEAKVVLLGD